MTIVIRNGDIGSSPDIVANSFVGSILVKFKSAGDIPDVDEVEVYAPDERDWKVANNVGNEVGFPWSERFNVDKKENRLLPGETFTLIIKFDDGVPADLELENWAVKWQDIGSADNCPAGEGECSDWAVVPEPITMLLLGTGLAGVGGAAALRRRRRGHDVTDA